jgi:hypothetical protein
LHECTSDDEPGHVPSLPPLHPNQVADGNERVVQEEVAGGDEMLQGEFAGGAETSPWEDWTVEGCEDLDEEGHRHKNAFYTIMLTHMTIPLSF